MGKKKRVAEEDLIIPKQDGRICGTICVCQMTLVLSCVAIVYLAVAVYMPALRAFKSEIIENPVMCTTQRAFLNKTCEKQTSCGEWCLSKGTGACTLVYVELRHNGSSLRFDNCSSKVYNRTCFGVDFETAQNYTCKYDSCKHLEGLFNCTSLGNCFNLTDTFECVGENRDPPIKCSARRGYVPCMNLTGIYNCSKGNCAKLKPPYNCDRKCTEIPTQNKNIILLSGNKVFLSKCGTVTDLSTMTDVWNESEDDAVLMASCYDVKSVGGTSLEATDCINGSVLHKKLGTHANFTELSNFLNYEAVRDPVIAPIDRNLTISNDSLLMINLEGCVNTLQEECKQFFKVYAKDGSDHNAKARFPCFYSKLNTSYSVVRFDLEGEYHQFLFAFLLPTILLAVSCFTLVVCQQIVVVGDDSKMRFKCDKESGALKNRPNQENL